MYSDSSTLIRACFGGAFLEGYRVVKSFLEEAKNNFIKPEELYKIYKEGYNVALKEGYFASEKQFCIDCEIHFIKLAAKQQNAFEVGYTTYKTSINEAKEKYSQTEDNLKKEFGPFKEQYEAKQEANKKAYEDKCAASHTKGIYAACDAGLDDFYDYDKLKATWEARYIIETEAINKVSHSPSSTAIRISLAFSEKGIATTPEFHNKVLETVPCFLNMRYGLRVDVSPDRPDVFILAPESAQRIDNLLNSDYPHRVMGMTVTFCRYALSVEDGAQECDEDDMCAICHDLLGKEQTTKPSCQHEFHERCLRHWASVCSSQEHRVSCPQCRTNLIN
jgi:hypothetical protein